MDLYHSFSYDGSAFKIAQGDTICFISGASICFWDLKTGERDYIWSPRNGFSVLETNHKYGLIAAADYGIKPNIYVYNCSDKEMIYTFEGASQLDILDLKISRDGKKLISVAGVPNYEVRIWNLDDGEQIYEGSYCVNHNFLKVLFNPVSSDSFCFLFKKKIIFGELRPEYNGSGENITKTWEITMKEHIIKDDYDQNTEFLDIVWDIKKKLYVSDKNARIHIVTPEDLNTISTSIDSNAIIMHLTQKHLIVAKENNQIDWYLLDDPENIDPLAFDFDFTLENETNRINQMIYNHAMTKVLVGTSAGSVYQIIKEAASNQEEEEDKDDKKEEEIEENVQEEVQKIKIEHETLGVFHSGAVKFISMVWKTNFLVSGGSEGSINIWHVGKKQLISCLVVNCKISSGCVNNEGNVLLVGSTKGVVRIFDISDASKIKLIKIYKFMNKEITFVGFSPDDELVTVAGNTKKLFFLYGKAQKNFSVLGNFNLPTKINAITYSKTQKMPSKYSLFALSPLGLLMAIVPPSTENGYENKQLDNEDCMIYGRRVDPDLYKIIVHDGTGDAYVSGRDKLLKRYKCPDELYKNMDHKIKVAPNPNDEQFGHQLPTNCFMITQNSKILISGGQDGSIFTRDFSDISKYKEVRGHNFKSQGVLQLCGSPLYPFLVISSGGDGSIFLWKLVDFEFADDSKVDQPEVNFALLAKDNIEDIEDENVLNYTKVLEEEYNLSQAETRFRMKEAQLNELNKIKASLNELIEANKYADELEKLNRDDFVIDLELRDKILQEGNKKREEMKQLSQRENYKQQILYQKIKERTWDKMDTHLKAVIGLHKNLIVFNYHIRKRTPEEMRKLQLIIDLRKIEIREKQQREERKYKEILNVENFCKKPDQYIVNGTGGLQKLVLVDYEAKEETPAEQKGKDIKVVGGASKLLSKSKATAQQAKEEQKKDEETEKKAQEDAKKKPVEDTTEWDYLYTAFDLFTDNRRKNQILIVKNLIFKIKQKFNQEFEQIVHLRQSQVDTITEKNNRIKEILKELKAIGELFEPKKTLLENPEHILNIKPEEVGFDRYLTKEEREKLEEERRKEEERIRLLNADDAGIRAIKQMMGGTLEEKKETALNEALIREEWMNKPVEDMTEEERLKLREFEIKEQKVKEENEKIRKNLELELRKLRNEITDICNRFDDRLFILLRRRLEYDYRLCEQELYIIKLTLAIISNEERIYESQIYDKKHKALEIKAEQLKEQMLAIETHRQKIEDTKNKVESEFNSVHLKNYTKGLHQITPDNIKAMYTAIFEEKKKDLKKASQTDDQLMELPQFKNILQKLDPYFELDKLDVKKTRDERFENFVQEIERRIEIFKNSSDVSEEDRTRCFQILQKKFDLKKELDKWENEYKDIGYSKSILEKEKTDTEEQYISNQALMQETHNIMRKNISDIEIQIRFLQGQVEIPQDKPVPSLSDAILIHRNLIEKKNEEIRKRGDEKIKCLEDIKNTKYEVAKAEHTKKKIEWTIRNIEAKTHEVHRLKVKKEMQMALTKKDLDHNQSEINKLNKQMQLLKEATEKRIQMYLKNEQKLRVEIEHYQRENQQLLAQGHSLSLTVKQRSDISKMMQRKNEENNAEGEHEGFKKFKEISMNKKLFELARRQTEEIELLREELNKLKAKTFANFSNIPKYQGNCFFL